MTHSVTLLQECGLTASRFSVYLKSKFTINHAWIVVLLLGYAENFLCVCVRERERVNNSDNRSSNVALYKSNTSQD